MRVHIVAVAGTGMGSLAGLLTELGHQVSGSDVAFDPPMGPALERWGVRCLHGFSERNLSPAPDLVVIGNVCRRDNPEAALAFERGLPITHIAGALQRFALSENAPLVVAGTHGKTTTTALAAWLLEAAGFAPGFLIGGIPKNFDRSFRSARSRPALPSADRPRPRRTPFVIEGDEYDTAFFEKSAKFLHYGAEVAIVTAIEHDHVDIYPTLDAYLEAFRRFIGAIPESGLVVANASDPLVVEIVRSAARAEVAWYALEGAPTHGCAPHWLAAPGASDASGTAFDLYAGGVACGRYALSLHGRHNLSNALAAIGAAVQGFGARLGDVGPALARFAGVQRRLDLLGDPGGVCVYDDFAHHPSAVRETLAALRVRHPGARLVAVFEPRSATACRKLHQAEYARAFAAADELLLAPLGRDLPEQERLDPEAICEELRAAGRSAEAIGSIDAIVDRLAARAQSGDVVALLSNGAFGGIGEKLVARLKAGEPLPR
jgi:UDP-N-acetylmuramate: L-alanyl-gamma-D-glutamyl-meso-diaminopimelate ligase